MKKEVNIIVRSTQTIEEDIHKEDSTRKFEISNMGTISYDDGEYVLEYEETELTGMAGTTTRLTFSDKKPGEVYMSREGSVSSSLYFKAGERYNTAYNTGIIPLQLSVSTKRLKNTVNYNGGEIEIDYSIEIHGLCAEETKLKVIVKC